jgi:hypothetical protein
MTAFYPRAVQRIIPPGANDPKITPRIAILHVDAGNADSLYDYFKNRSGGIESHFFVKKDGTVEQYRGIYDQADANLDANDFAVSIETQGFAAGEWTDAQLKSIKALLLWLHAEAGIPLVRCTAWDGHGVGYHTMWGAPSHWTPVAKTCPGPDRIKQFDAILVPWMAAATQVRRRIRHLVVTTNLYVHNLKPALGVRRIAWRCRLRFLRRPDVIACQETHGSGTLQALTGVRGYRLFVAADKGEAARELGVLLRARLRCLGVELVPTVPGVGTGVTAHPRAAFVVKYLKAGRKVAVVNTHGPVFGEVDAAAGRVGESAQQASEHAGKVADLVDRLEHEGFLVFVTADANARQLDNRDSWPHALPRVLVRIGMRLTQHRVDLIASDPNKVSDPAELLIPAKVTGSDTHDAIACRYTEKRTA